MVAQDLTARDSIGRDQKLLVRDLSVVFTRRRGGTVAAVEKLSLGVRDEEFVSIVGPSGCGKSTLLRIIAGLIRPSAGEVFVDARPVEGPGADRGMVFQSYTLFPWLTVQGNVECDPTSIRHASIEECIGVATDARLHDRSVVAALRAMMAKEDGK